MTLELHSVCVCVCGFLFLILTYIMLWIQSPVIVLISPYYSKHCLMLLGSLHSMNCHVHVSKIMCHCREWYNFTCYRSNFYTSSQRRYSLERKACGQKRNPVFKMFTLHREHGSSNMSYIAYTEHLQHCESIQSLHNTRLKQQYDFYQLNIWHTHCKV